MTGPDTRFNWRRSKWVAGGAVALVAVSLFLIFRRHPSPPANIYEPQMQLLTAALGAVTADEAARLLNGQSGAAVLVVPEVETHYHESAWAVCERGFRKALAGKRLKLAGIYFATPPTPENPEDRRAPTYQRLEDIRQRYPKARVLVLFVGHPRFTEEEQQRWRDS